MNEKPISSSDPCGRAQGELRGESHGGEGALLRRQAILVGNRHIANGVHALDLLDPGLAESIQPGQFVMLAVGEGIVPFLRRPFAVAGIDKNEGLVRLIVQIVGKGSGIIAGWEPGVTVRLLGPLGKGFTWRARAESVILTGGGIGIAPLLPLAKELRMCGKEVHVFVGAKSMDLLFGLDAFVEYGCRLVFTTEDSSGGIAGFVTQPLEEYLKKAFAQIDDPFPPPTAVKPNEIAANANEPPTPAGGFGLPAALYACGPTPFLQVVAALCMQYSLEAQLSLEERMGCGFGACMGCSVQTKSPTGAIVRKRVCHDGPVFFAEEVVFGG